MTKHYLWILAALWAGQTVQAQGKAMEVQELDEVVLIDSKFALQRENSGKTVIKITARELRQNQGRSIAEIINAKSGMEISGSRGRMGDVLGLYARGGRGKQVLILIDGVRISDPSTFSQEYDLRLLSPTLVESIEIIKRAASTLSGSSQATAGNNITTKQSPQHEIVDTFMDNVGTQQRAEDKE